MRNTEKKEDGYFKIEKNKLKQFLDKLEREYTVFVPVESEGVTSFMEIGKTNFYNTDRPPKEIFFPQTETMLSYDGKDVKPSVYEGKPIAIFGVRPCDAKSFLMLDKVFETEKYTDTYWKEKYEDAFVFGLGCNKPLSTCFCNWFGRGPFNKEGADVFLVEPCNEKGEKAIHELPLQKATEDDLKEGEKVKDESEAMLSKPIELTSLKENLDRLWDNPIWEKIAYKCLNCAACSYLCPTCHCFDIQDEGKGVKGKRIRIWDSCMFKLFTQEAAGTNPKPTGKERIRQRVTHKFNYLVENIGEFGCVGCGRCIISCPVNIDVREVIKEIRK